MKLKIFLLLAFLSIGTISLLLWWFSNSSSSEKKDPIGYFLDLPIPPSSADFITSKFNKYSGETPSWVDNCIKTAPVSLKKGQVFAKINNEEIGIMMQEKIDGIFDKQSILIGIDSVFGHAVRNNEINWQWNKEESQYTFKIEPGQEPFLYCYFKNEPKFFSRLFQSNSIYYGVESESLQYEYEEESIRVYNILDGANTISGLAPWGTEIKGEGENNKTCSTLATKDNTFSCSIDQIFREGERVYVYVVLPNQKEFTLIKIVGNKETGAEYCALNRGQIDKCKVQ